MLRFDSELRRIYRWESKRTKNFWKCALQNRWQLQPMRITFANSGAAKSQLFIYVTRGNVIIDYLYAIPKKLTFMPY